MKKVLPWVLAVVPALVFLQSLPFKFTGAAETQYIFVTIGDWFRDLGLAPLGDFFAGPGPYVVGACEGLAAVLLLIPATRPVGGMLGAVLLAGAIFFHIATPLGVAVTLPGTQGGDPTLFIMAVVGFACCVATVLLNASRPREG